MMLTLTQILLEQKKLREGKNDYPYYAALLTACPQLNKYVMVVLFCVPLTVLALFETRLDTKGSYINNWFENNGLGDESSPEAQNPRVDDETGLQISKVEFKDLIKVFPNTNQVCSSLVYLSICLIRISRNSPQRLLFYAKFRLCSAELMSWRRK